MNASNYDTWFDYVRLEETYGDVDKAREVYERAIAIVPPAAEVCEGQRQGKEKEREREENKREREKREILI